MWASGLEFPRLAAPETKFASCSPLPCGFSTMSCDERRFCRCCTLGCTSHIVQNLNFISWNRRDRNSVVTFPGSEQFVCSCHGSRRSSRIGKAKLSRRNIRRDTPLWLASGLVASALVVQRAMPGNRKLVECGFVILPLRHGDGRTGQHAAARNQTPAFE